MLVSSLVITLHYLVTVNLFDIHFIPNRMSSMLLLTVWSLLFVYGVKFGFRFSKKFKLTKTKIVKFRTKKNGFIFSIFEIFSKNG